VPGAPLAGQPNSAEFLVFFIAATTKKRYGYCIEPKTKPDWQRFGFNPINVPMKTLARIGAVVSFLFCLLGGLWILGHASLKNFTSGDDAMSIAIGFYFVGKAFFVGPMLFIAAEKIGCCRPEKQ